MHKHTSLFWANRYDEEIVFCHCHQGVGSGQRSVMISIHYWNTVSVTESCICLQLWNFQDSERAEAGVLNLRCDLRLVC
jgi:hypothetical protein